MGLILPPRRVSADSSGNGRNAATLTVYEAGTTTLASVYSEASLSTPLTNPVVANSAGVFPPIYAAEGALFDLIEKTSAGATLNSEDDVPAMGVDSGALTRDFTNARAKISGTAGVVDFEAGDPTGDDVGGKWRIGGWAGTQATTGEIDAAATTVTGTLAVSGTLNATGIITENAKKLPGVVYETTTPAAAAGIVIALTESPANVRSWLIEGIDVVMSAAAAVSFTISYDNGATYKGGASDYGFIRAVMAVTSVTVGTTSTDVSGVIATTASTPTDRAARINMTVTTVESGNGATIIEGKLSAHDNSATPLPLISEFIVYGQGNYGRATHIKLSVASGTITGTFRVIPQRGFGE